MDDMDAFERQLSAEFRVLMGPVRPVDDAAILRAITATQSPTWRIHSRLSANTFLVAGAVVALFGGFLLAGMLSQPRADDLAPAASALASEPPRLVYMLDDDIYVAEEDGTDAVRIIDGDADDECDGIRGNRGLVSPDGRHIAYRSEWHDDCPGKVFIADLDGRIVASVPGAGWDIAWSPDGTRFATWLSFGTSIGVYGIDGAPQAELDGSVFPGGDHDPRWSPDGTALEVPAHIDATGRLLAAGDPWDETTQEVVARLPLDGGKPQALPANDLDAKRAVSYSPDGSHAAFTVLGPWPGDPPTGSVAASARAQLVIVATDGTEPAMVFEFEPGEQVVAGWGRRPLWSPRGDRIAVVGSRYSAGRRDSASLRVIDPTTGLATTVANVEGEGDLEPVVFSPDGDRILVREVDADGTETLTSVASDGSGSTVIVAGADVGMWVPSSRAWDDPIGP